MTVKTNTPKRKSSIKRTVKDQSGAGKIKIGELLSKAGYITPAQLEYGKKELKKRGVKIRIAAPLTKESIPAAKDVSDVAEVKHIGKIQARFTIIDGKEMTFMVLNDEDVHPSYDVGIWVNTPFFSSALEQFFELAWKELKPLSKIKV